MDIDKANKIIAEYIGHIAFTRKQILKYSHRQIARTKKEAAGVAEQYYYINSPKSFIDIAKAIEALND